AVFRPSTAFIPVSSGFPLLFLHRLRIIRRLFVCRSFYTLSAGVFPTRSSKDWPAEVSTDCRPQSSKAAGKDRAQLRAQTVVFRRLQHPRPMRVEQHADRGRILRL